MLLLSTCISLCCVGFASSCVELVSCFTSVLMNAVVDEDRDMFS